ncbi:MAG: transposase [Deltaproteobacteria bacterium]|nr:transposase [Deltaproteobacteria bacterium]
MGTRRARPVQLALPMHRHGGARQGAGRPRSSTRVTHAARPTFDGARTPLHVTLRMARGVWNLRSQRGYRCVEHALAAERARDALRVVHFSVQGNHVHLIVEADDRKALSRRMQGLGIRLARRVNAMMGRPRGRVLADRYHARVLATPREVHRAIAYVLCNHHKHSAQAGRRGFAVDPFSSAPVFRHFAKPSEPLAWSPGKGPPPVAPPTTWLLARGWLRLGPIEPPV